MMLDVDLRGPVNLQVSLECGQAFRWRRSAFPDRPDLKVAYRGVLPAGGRQLAIIAGQTDNVTTGLTVAFDEKAVAGLSRTVLKDAVLKYFSASDDLKAIEESVGRGDPVMAEAVPHSHGLRILQQDHWECLGSYVLSINNNIPNITRIVEHFARCLGEPAGMGEYGFPSPEKVACQESAFLRQSRCGFRDRYLKDAAERVRSGEVDLVDLERMPTEQARERLMRIRGVGPKVADCVLLFGYHRLDVFPVDVWIARAMSSFFLGGRAVTPKVAREEGMRRFGQLAGYAQEYLFYTIRQ